MASSANGERKYRRLRRVFERAAHRGHTVVDHRRDRRRHVMRQQVGDPHQAAAALAVGEHLHRGVVVRQPAADSGPGHATILLVDIDDQLARDDAIGKGDDARVTALDPAIGDEAFHQSRVQRADVAERPTRHRRPPTRSLRGESMPWRSPVCRCRQASRMRTRRHAVFGPVHPLRLDGAPPPLSARSAARAPMRLRAWRRPWPARATPSRGGACRCG